MLTYDGAIVSGGDLSGVFFGLAQPFPFPREQLVQAGGGQIGNAREGVGKPGLWVDLVEAACGDHGQHDGSPVGPTLGTCEGPVPAPESDTAQRSFRGVVRETNPSVLEEEGKTLPALEHVIDRLDDLGGSAERGALLRQPLAHVIEQRLALLLAHSQSLLCAQAVDLALDFEQRVIPFDAPSAIGEIGLPLRL